LLVIGLATATANAISGSDNANSLLRGIQEQLALAAIHHVDANWLTDDHQFEQLVEGNIESLLSVKLANEKQNKQQIQSMIEKVAPVLKQALEAEPNSWQTDEVRQLCRAVIEQYMVDKI
jgi:hypothetical protein